MAAQIFVAKNEKSAAANPEGSSVLLEANGYYWFLYRYFGGANLDRSSELVDLYGDSEIDGYQLHRLETELSAALEDVSHKPERWRVLTGWDLRSSAKKEPAVENETWREVERERMVHLIRQLLWLIEFAKEQRLKLICSGD